MHTDALSQILGFANLLGGAHGLFLATLIAMGRGRERASRLLLAGFTLSYSLVVAGTMLGALGYYLTFPHLIRVGDPFVLLLGPLLYLYVVVLREGEFRPAQWLHLAPFALYTAIIIPTFYALPAEVKIAFVEGVMVSPDPGFWALNLARMVHVGVYVFLMLRLLRRHRFEVEQTHSNIRPLSLDWARRLIYLFAFIWCFAVAAYIVAFAGWIVFLQANYLIAFVMSVIVYAIGYSGLRQSAIHEQLIPDVSGAPSAKAVARLQEVFAGVRSAMQKDRLWLNCDLNIQELADHIEQPKYLVSAAINELSGRSFNDFVNAYRVEEVKRRLRESGAERFTILAHAMESGFRSKSSFNAAFRKHTGKTPSAFSASMEADERERVRV